MILCSWDSEEYALIGSVEFAEVRQCGCNVIIPYSICTSPHSHLMLQSCLGSLSYSHYCLWLCVGPSQATFTNRCGLSQCRYSNQWLVCVCVRACVHVCMRARTCMCACVHMYTSGCVIMCVWNVFVLALICIHPDSTTHPQV